MKMNLSTSLLSLCTLVIPGYASAAIVKGALCDSGLEAIPFATVRVFSSNDTIRPAAMFAADSEGNFKGEIDGKGTFRIIVEAVGKQSIIHDIKLAGDETIDLGTLSMEDDTSLLDELEVVAVRQIVKSSADKLTYNVEEDSDSKAYTLLDMLRKVPMVSVDGEDNITVNGSSDFQVYVNGKPSLLFSGNPSKIFKSMPASVVRTVEVVTNPGARYDAEGAGGVLNLVMAASDKNVSDGYTASAGAHAGVKGYDGSLYLSGQHGRFSYSLNGTLSRLEPGTTDIITSQVFPDRIILSESTSKPKIDFSLGNINASYAIDSLTDIGISGAINGFRMNTGFSSANSITTPQGLNLLDYSNNGEIDLDRLSVNGSLSLSHGFGDARHSDISLIYQFSSEHSDNENSFNFSGPEENLIDLSDRIIKSPETTTEHILQADFSTKPREGHSLEAGMKLALRKARSSSFSHFDDPDKSSATDYRSHNNIGAAYAEYGIASGAFTGKAGLRYEHTWHDVDFKTSDGDDFSRDYGTFVPSASISWAMNASNSLAATYNMRISRPGISYMNPFIDNSNPTEISYGNPDLDVEKTHNVGIAYTRFSQRLMLNARISDSHTGNGIERYSFYSDGLLNTTYGNVAKRNNLRLDAYINWMAGENTRFILNGGIGYARLKSEALSLSNSGWNWNIMAGIQQTLPLDIKAAMYLIASSRTYNLQGWNNGFKMISLNLSRTFLNDRLNVSAGFLTGLSKGGDIKMENYSSTARFITHNSIRVPIMNLNVGLSYSFGNLSAKNKKDLKEIESDYIEHTSNMEALPGMMGK